MLDVVMALAALDPAGFGLDDICAQLESSTYVMADEARPHFRVDPAHRQSYREDLVGASRTPPQSRQTRSAVANALRARLSAPSTTSRLIARISCDQRVRLQVTRFGVGVTPHQRVAGAINARPADVPLPVSITVDRGTEFTSKALEEWAWRHGVKLDFIRPGKRMENGHIEFNGRLRDECLNVTQFMSIEDARAKIEAWRIDYNQRRPHSSLGHLTPSEFVRNRQVNRDREAAEL